MSKYWFLLLIPIILGAYFLFNDNRNIIIITGTETPPFEYYQDGKLVGIDIVFLERIFSKLNIEYKIELVDWEEALNKMKRGEADLILGAGYTEERESYLSYRDEQKLFETGQTAEVPKDVLWLSNEAFIYPKEKNFDVSSLEIIKEKDYSVGIVAGYYYFKSLWDTELNIYAYPTTEKLIQALENNEIDMILIDTLEGFSVMDSLNIDSEKYKISKPYNQGGNYLLFSKKYDKPKYAKIKNEFYDELIRLKEEENLHETAYLEYTGMNFSELYSLS
ncbi:amino acid ABC transporter substrate-binding protein [archaeon]|nr:amino acid ABC transporter substrate-binding protein [archaeon]